MLDVFYLALTLALFALVGLIARGAGRLAPGAPTAVAHDTRSEGEPR